MSLRGITTTATGALVEPLHQAQSEEALAFLCKRPWHTVIMAGLLREHGPTVSTPQGSFYSFRDNFGQLEGIALVGRTTMFEARTQTALEAFAELARKTASVRMIMGEEDRLREFLRLYASGTEYQHLSGCEMFYMFKRQKINDEGLAGFRLAQLNDLEQVATAHAEVIEAETGSNPLEVDSVGFRQRCADRIRQGRVWALIEQGELIFKADVVTETPEAAYLEGVWVKPNRRREGYGRRCWAELSRVILDRLPSFCGFVKATNPAHIFYQQMGGTLLGRYDKVYV